MLSSKIIALLSCFAALSAANFTIWSDVLDQIDSTQIRNQVVNAHRFLNEFDPNSDLRISGLLLYKHASNVTAHHPGLDTDLDSVLSDAKVKPRMSARVTPGGGLFYCDNPYCFSGKPLKPAFHFNSGGDRDAVERSACRFIQYVKPDSYTYVGVLVTGLICRHHSPKILHHCTSLVKVFSSKSTISGKILGYCSNALDGISDYCKKSGGNRFCVDSDAPSSAIYTVQVSSKKFKCENSGRDRICKVKSCKSAHSC